MQFPHTWRDVVRSSLSLACPLQFRDSPQDTSIHSNPHVFRNQPAPFRLPIWSFCPLCYSLKAELKKRQAELDARAAHEAWEAAEKAKADEEAARAEAAKKAAAAGIVHGRGTRLSTGVLVGGGNNRCVCAFKRQKSL